MEREFLKQIVISQRKRFLNKSQGIRREALEIVGKKLIIPHVLVLTGVRRCGKSTLMRQIAASFFNNSDFYYLNFEDERLIQYRAEEFDRVYEVLIELFGEHKTFFIDEIQNIPHFELFVRRFYDEGFKFIITGSNSELLSSELGSRLTGRYIELRVKPFSFTEYLQFHNVPYSGDNLYLTESRALIMQYFARFLQNGSMPEYTVYNDNEILQRTYEDIVIKDIAVRHKVDNPILLRELYQYLMANIGNRYSYQSLLNIVNMGSVNTAKKYVQYFTESFLGMELSQFHYSIKKRLVNPKKLYVTDNGFVQLVSVGLSENLGWLLENIVAQTLHNSGELYYYSGKGECDFVLLNGKNRIVVQVCYTLNDKNKAREIGGLLEASAAISATEQFLLTNDQEETLFENGVTIPVIPLWKWLLYKAMEKK